MELDLETFLITLYVMTDEWYQKVILPRCRSAVGQRRSCATAKCCAWRWPPNGAAVCPGRPNGASCGCLEALTPVLSRHDQPKRLQSPGAPAVGRLHSVADGISGQMLTADDCEVLDCVPVRVAHGSRSFHPGWLADIAAIGKGGNDRYSMACISCWWSARPVCPPVGR